MNELYKSLVEVLEDLQTDLFMAYLLLNVDVKDISLEVCKCYLERVSGYYSQHMEDAFCLSRSFLDRAFSRFGDDFVHLKDIS